MVTYRFAHWTILGIFILSNHLDAGPKRKSAEISNNQDQKSLESLDSLIVQPVDHKKLETLIEQNLFFKKVLLEQGYAIVDLKSSLEAKNQELSKNLSDVLATYRRLQEANIQLQATNSDLKKSCARFKLDISWLKKRINDDKAEALGFENKIDEMGNLIVKTRKATATVLYSVEKMLNDEQKTLMPPAAAQKGLQSVYQQLPFGFSSSGSSADSKMPKVLSNSSICSDSSASWKTLTGSQSQVAGDFAQLFPSFDEDILALSSIER